MNVLGKIEGGKIVFIALDSELPLTERQNHDWRVIGQIEKSGFEKVLDGTWLGKPLLDENGIVNYKLVDNVPIERTDAEKQAELAARPAPLPSDKERLAALEKAVLAIALKGV